ncbi:MAG: 3'-5' exonuclease [Deltaproteobacteria bacterium]|nr:3'-5' exonuclease [Deltaproteobacteria bacterium]
MTSLIESPRDTVVLDFETSGMSPAKGARVIEVGAVRLRKGRIVDRFQSLANPNIFLDDFITDLTGITNEMVHSAEPIDEVMEKFSNFIGDDFLVAHNSSFDQKFLDAELVRIGCHRPLTFGCSLLVSRRVYPQSPNHKLATLVDYKDLPTSGTYHRALADAEMTAYLWLMMEADLKEKYSLSEIPFSILSGLGRISPKKVDVYLAKHGFS